MEMQDLIANINRLAHKKRTIGLTEAELLEQQALYKEYLAIIRGRVKAQLDNITIVDAEELH